MARERNRNNPDEPPKRGAGDEAAGEGGEERRRSRRRRPTLGNPNADPVKIHREYVERHLGGAGSETPEAYAEALKQWHEIPGAVSRPPPELSGEPPRHPERQGVADDKSRDEESPA